MSVFEIPELPPMKVGANTVRGRSYYYMQTYTHHYDKTLQIIKNTDLLFGVKSFLNNIRH